MHFVCCFLQTSPTHWMIIETKLRDSGMDLLWGQNTSFLKICFGNLCQISIQQLH